MYQRAKFCVDGLNRCVNMTRVGPDHQRRRRRRIEIKLYA